MKKRIVVLLALLMSLTAASAREVFSINGPERSYNQIWVVNRTSQENFDCRVVVMNDDKETVKEVYGIYHLKGYDDRDSNTNKIKRGTTIGVEMPKGFPVKVNLNIEYRDYPFFDAIIITIVDDAANDFE